MCIMASDAEVSGTNILAAINGDRQIVIYQAVVEFDDGEKNAIILPVPCESEDIDLVDMSGNEDLFEVLNANFHMKTRGTFSGESEYLGGDFLEVQDVGAYQVSIVPNVSDLERINPDLFVMSEATKNTLRLNYAKGFSFVVAVLKPGRFQPLCYTHKALPNGKIFVPTRHEHGDGKDRPSWDHIVTMNKDIQKNIFVSYTGPKTVPINIHRNGTLLMPGIKLPGNLNSFFGVNTSHWTQIKINGRNPNIDLEL